jgi:hypothetical protein
MLIEEGSRPTIDEFVYHRIELRNGLDACRLTCAEDDREGLKKEYQEYLRSHADTPGSAAYTGTAEMDLRQVPF